MRKKNSGLNLRLCGMELSPFPQLVNITYTKTGRKKKTSFDLKLVGNNK